MRVSESTANVATLWDPWDRVQPNTLNTNNLMGSVCWQLCIDVTMR